MYTLNSACIESRELSSGGAPPRGGTHFGEEVGGSNLSPFFARKSKDLLPLIFLCQDSCCVFGWFLVIQSFLFCGDCCFSSSSLEQIPVSQRRDQCCGSNSSCPRPLCYCPNKPCRNCPSLDGPWFLSFGPNGGPWHVIFGPCDNRRHHQRPTRKPRLRITTTTTRTTITPRRGLGRRILDTTACPQQQPPQPANPWPFGTFDIPKPVP